MKTSTLFEATKGMDIIVIVNKTDLEQKLDLDRVRELAGESACRDDFLIKRGRD